jgi:hypothetical protein
VLIHAPLSTAWLPIQSAYRRGGSGVRSPLPDVGGRPPRDERTIQKKQDGIVNSLKIRNVNRLLTELRKLLAKDPSLEFVEMLDEETLPQNSDVVLLLSQWRAALHQYKQRHSVRDSGEYEDRWSTVENP